MKKKKQIVTNAMRLLDAAKIDYETVFYEADEVGDNFGMEIANLTGIPVDMSFKTLVAKGDKTGIMVACVSVDNEVDLKKLATISKNKKVEMIHVKDLLSLTGYIRGGVSPIGMKKKYPTYVNDSALSHDKIAVSAGVCGATVILTPNDLQKITECEYGDIQK
ncbi:MAG: Cys-tRNA(Pro) deacylase [Clostridia bacterium]|nr:Cys-tRNA(Pro) deacylase [Clostridia bacterium]